MDWACKHDLANSPQIQRTQSMFRNLAIGIYQEGANELAVWVTVMLIAIEHGGYAERRAVSAPFTKENT